MKGKDLKNNFESEFYKTVIVNFMFSISIFRNHTHTHILTKTEEKFSVKQWICFMIVLIFSENIFYVYVSQNSNKIKQPKTFNCRRLVYTCIVPYILFCQKGGSCFKIVCSAWGPYYWTLTFYIEIHARRIELKSSSYPSSSPSHDIFHTFQEVTYFITTLQPTN